MKNTLTIVLAVALLLVSLKLIHREIKGIPELLEKRTKISWMIGCFDGVFITSQGTVPPEAIRYFCNEVYFQKDFTEMQKIIKENEAEFFINH